MRSRSPRMRIRVWRENSSLQSLPLTPPATRRSACWQKSFCLCRRRHMSNETIHSWVLKQRVGLRHLFASPDFVWHCYKPLLLTPDNKKAAVDLLQLYQPWYEATCLCCDPFAKHHWHGSSWMVGRLAVWQSRLGIGYQFRGLQCLSAHTHLNSMGCSRTNVFSIYLRCQNDHLQPVVVGEKVTRRIPKDPANKYIKALIVLKKKNKDQVKCSKTMVFNWISERSHEYFK